MNDEKLLQEAITSLAGLEFILSQSTALHRIPVPRSVTLPQLSLLSQRIQTSPQIDEGQAYACSALGKIPADVEAKFSNNGVVMDAPADSNEEANANEGSSAQVEQTEETMQPAQEEEFDSSWNGEYDSFSDGAD